MRICSYFAIFDQFIEQKKIYFSDLHPSYSVRFCFLFEKSSHLLIIYSYIEVFKSTYAEARTSIMNDTQSMARQRGGAAGGGSGGPNQNYGSQRQGNHGGGGGYNNQYNGPPPNNFNSYGGGGNNYPMNNQMGGGSGVKREI